MKAFPPIVYKYRKFNLVLTARNASACDAHAPIHFCFSFSRRGPLRPTPSLIKVLCPRPTFSKIMVRHVSLSAGTYQRGRSSLTHAKLPYQCIARARINIANRFIPTKTPKELPCVILLPDFCHFTSTQVTEFE